METTAKRAHIADIRDNALQILWARGTWKEVGDKHLAVEIGECALAYRTPFQKAPEPSESMRHWAAQAGRKIDHGYGLDIWFRQKKVLIIVWDEGVPFEIIWYEPGEWEGELSGATLPASPIQDLNAIDGD